MIALKFNRGDLTTEDTLKMLLIRLYPLGECTNINVL